MLECLNKFGILELSRVFMFQMLWKITDGGVSRVRPGNYRNLLHMFVASKSFPEFIAKCEQPGSEWSRMGELDTIHDKVLDKELGSVDTLAARASLKTLHVHMARLYGRGGLLPDPSTFELTFSAAFEFLRSSTVKVRNGANLRKNDRGMYIDQQLFFYLADPEAVVVSNEDFTEDQNHFF
jgi:hypothetical protein